MDITVLIAAPVAAAWLLLIVGRAGVGKRLPWFAWYVLWELLEASAQLASWLIDRRLYVALYWWMEALEIVLTVLAVRESFLRIFRGFTKIRWFRWTVSIVIGAVVAYAGWKAIYHPPVQGNRLTALIVGTEFLFRWIVAGIALLTIILTFLLEEPSETQEDAVIAGFGIIAGGFVLTMVCVSLFGNKYLWFSKYAPSVGYFIAVFLWIWVFSRPIEGFGFEDLGIGPEDLLRLMRRYREGLSRVRGQQ